jgi:hypothetical protein
MLTIFTIPKAFRGHIATIQRNAITSWAKVKPRPEVILLGKDEVSAEMAQELGLRYIPDVAVNEFGTPLLDDLFRKAEDAASFPQLCYVNADILLTSDFLQALEKVWSFMPKSLTVSKRINLDIHKALEFGPNWESDLRRLAARDWNYRDHRSIDAFAYRKEMYPLVPSFAIGRLWWDHWLIKAVREQNLPVVDISLVAPLFHQNHDYNHVPGGQKQVWGGEEAQRNFLLSGGVKDAYTLLDVTHELLPDGRLRRVRFRKQIHKAKAIAWELLINRTARVRHAIALRRTSSD